MQLLITGCYRSGTTYASFLLGNHPDLEITMYTTSFMRFCYDRYNPIEKEYNYAKLLFDAAERIRKRHNKNLDIDKILVTCSKSNKVTYALLYDLMMNNLFLSNGVKIWGEKIQQVWTKIPDFLDMFPNGKAINIIRDPRNVLASFKRITYAPPPAYLGAIFNCYGSMQSSLEYAQKFGGDCFYNLKYEDLILSPKKELIKLFNFLGLSSNHDLLNQDGWMDSGGKQWIHNSAFVSRQENGENFDNNNFIESWKRNLEDWEIILCEAINGEYFTDFDYELSGLSGNWKKIIKPFIKNNQIGKFAEIYENRGKGVEEFPTDPLSPSNWSENNE